MHLIAIIRRRLRRARVPVIAGQSIRDTARNDGRRQRRVEPPPPLSAPTLRRRPHPRPSPSSATIDETTHCHRRRNGVHAKTDPLPYRRRRDVFCDDNRTLSVFFRLFLFICLFCFFVVVFFVLSQSFSPFYRTDYRACFHRKLHSTFLRFRIALQRD